MSRKAVAPPAVLAAGILLLGCGSAPASSSSARPAPRTADQLYADYVTALRSARSEHYTGSVTFSDGTVVVVDVTATQTAAHLVAHTGGTTVEEIVSGGKAYARGGAHGPDWVVLPASEALSAESLTLQHEADCAAREHGHLTMGPESVVDGRRVGAVIDDGRAAGASPQTGYMTLDAPVHLVKVVQTGRETPGGSPDCGHEPGPVSVAATVNFDSFDSPVAITPPPNPADLNGPVI